MASIKVLASFLLSWEGGFVNDPKDRGGATNKGVTLATWRKVGYDKDGDGDIDVSDLKLISVDDAVKRVLKPYYWDKVCGDKINSQAIANLMADWAYNSGASRPVKAVQTLLKCVPDGIMGNKTLGAINGYSNPQELFNRLWNERRAFYQGIVARNPSQSKFLKGWMNRINGITYHYLKGADGKIVTW